MGTARSWWPDYLFHYTDILNAAKILMTGALLSRNEASKLRLMRIDNASQDIIADTDDELKNYVRLYFRPRTPTQYNNEGFRPVTARSRQSHCPVPIYFLFYSEPILSRADSQFTYGNLKSARETFNSASDFEKIPFQSVYHLGPFEPHERNAIVFHRHAEVIVPGQLDLGALRYIVCRSQAEYETFLHLLPASIRRHWRNRIGLGNRMNLFDKHWTYVQSVDLSSTRTVFRFNTPSRTPGPFHANASFTDTVSDRQFTWEKASFSTDEPLPLDLSKIGPLWDYYVRLSFDGHIAYAGRYQEELPW